MKAGTRAGLFTLLALVAISLVSAVALTWPVTLTIDTAVMVDDEIPLADLLLPTWMSWYYSSRLPDLLLKPSLFFRTDLLNYPAGYDLWHNVPHQFLSIPEALLTYVCGYPAGISLFQILTLAANMACMAWVVYLLTGRIFLGAVLGILYGASPIFLREVMALRTEQTIGFCAPLAAYCLVVYRRDRSKRSQWLLGAALALTAVTYVFYGLFCLVLVGLALVFDLVNRRKQTAAVIREYGRIIAAFILLSLPFTLPYMVSLSRGKVVQGVSFGSFLMAEQKPERAAEEHGAFDEGGVPGTGFSPGVMDADGVTVTGPENTNNRGYAPLKTLFDSKKILAVSSVFLIALLVAAWRRGTWFWPTAALVFWVFALGPEISFGSAGTAGPLPGALLNRLPLFSRLLVPLRYLVFFNLCFAVGTALMAGRISPPAADPLPPSRRLILRWRSAGIMAAVFLLVLTRWQVSLRVVRVPETSPVLSYLAQQPGGAVIDLPLSSGELGDHATWHQTMHGHPVLAVPDSRVSVTEYTGIDQQFKDNSVLSLLSRVGGKLPGKTGYREEDMIALRRAGFRYVLLHTALLESVFRGAGASDRVLGDKLLFGKPPETTWGRRLLAKIETDLIDICGASVAIDSRFVLFELPPAPSLGSMVPVPAGWFIMGADPEEGEVGRIDEQPAHRVYLDAYYIDVYEVTNLEYSKFVAATGHRAPFWWDGRDVPEGQGRHPVNAVSWADAAAYATWVGKRLPTEAEWEKAARGTDGRKYPWGNIFSMSRGNCQSKYTQPVGNFPSGISPYGCYDMTGNVWELVSDWYRTDYYRRAPEKNPKGPLFGSHHVLKGGSFHTEFAVHFIMRSATRYGKKVHPEENPAFGFRCAKDVD